MKRYDKATLAAIDDNADLTEYVLSRYPTIERGDNYFMNCPKHTDCTPSLCVSRTRNRYKCFSCGIGGGIISWLCNIEGLSFNEAVRKASGGAAMPVPESVRIMAEEREVKEEQKQNKILDESIFEMYEQSYPSEWINEGITTEVLDLFDIRIDKRSNRIVYPVRDINGNLINVKGRTRYERYKELGFAKYINYFPIGCMDYLQSLDITKDEVKKSGELIIFESIKSVMKLYSAGIKNSASAEKHSLTKEQIKTIISLGCDITIAYDNDVDKDDPCVLHDINLLKRFADVYMIKDTRGLLGTKDSPIDCGIEIWNKLYRERRRM